MYKCYININSIIIIIITRYDISIYNRRVSFSKLYEVIFDTLDDTNGLHLLEVLCYVGCFAFLFLTVFTQTNKTSEAVY